MGVGRDDDRVKTNPSQSSIKNIGSIPKSKRR